MTSWQFALLLASPFLVMVGTFIYVKFFKKFPEAGDWLVLEDMGALTRREPYIRLLDGYYSKKRLVRFEFLLQDGLIEVDEAYDLDDYKFAPKEVSAKLEKIYQERLNKKKNALARLRVKSMEWALKK